MKPTVKQNLEALRAAIAVHEESLFDLNAYVRKTGCDTLYCSAGLAATMPFFTNQLTPHATRIYHLYSNSGIDGIAFCLARQEQMWGDNSYGRIFTSAGFGEYDGQIANNQDPLDEGMSDKELALARIDMALQELT